MFFDQYPKISYPFTFGGNVIYKQMVDITTNVRLDQQTLDSVINYNYDVVNDGATPEVISYNSYKTPFNHHLIILANDNREDWRESYPLTSTEFESYIKEKYANPYGIHHFEDPQGNEIDNLYDNSDGTGARVSYPKNVIPITNYEYESRLNENKRYTKIIKPELTDTVNQLIKEKIINDNE